MKTKLFMASVLLFAVAACSGGTSQNGAVLPANVPTATSQFPAHLSAATSATSIPPGLGGELIASGAFPSSVTMNYPGFPAFCWPVSKDNKSAYYVAYYDPAAGHWATNVEGKGTLSKDQEIVCFAGTTNLIPIKTGVTYYLALYRVDDE